MPENFLSFNDVSYVLPNGETLFSGISFDVSRGEKAALTGPNGIGKQRCFSWPKKSCSRPAAVLSAVKRPLFCRRKRN
ncbi:MAG: hypothetical protein J6L82_03540 [Alphaproteobacteria bacterium]|nr:hypothetical protein [Alphaproteobacteria bacterium]